MRRLEEILEYMERNNHSENSDNNDEEEGDPGEVRVLSMLMKACSKPRVEPPMYECNLDVEELMDWINSLNKYFYFDIRGNLGSKIGLIRKQANNKFL